VVRRPPAGQLTVRVVHDRAGRIRRALTDPVLYAGLTQTVKTAVAAVVAWQLAVHLTGHGQSLLAPWAAVLTVHATVYRTFSEGLRQVIATVLGVVIAYLFGDLVGLSSATFGLAVLVALLVGRHPRLGPEGITVATTVLVVLATGAGDSSSSLTTRLADTGIGILVGGLINVLVWPPLRDRAAARAVDAVDRRLGTLLLAMAAGIRAGHTADEAPAWIDRTNTIDQRIDDAWALVGQAGESARFNLRRSPDSERPVVDVGGAASRRTGRCGDPEHGAEPAASRGRAAGVVACVPGALGQHLGRRGRCTARGGRGRPSRGSLADRRP
jgi:uncharacterized membrane protein YccC